MQVEIRKIDPCMLALKGYPSFEALSQKYFHCLSIPGFSTNNQVLICQHSGTCICCVQFYPWFKFYFPLCLSMVMYNNEFETNGNKILNQGIK